MRASIANAECGLPERPHTLWSHLRCDLNEKRPHRREFLCGLSRKNQVLLFVRLVGFRLRLGFGSGLFAEGCLDAPCSVGWACETSNIRVPLSRCTFFPLTVITRPFLGFETCRLRFGP